MKDKLNFKRKRIRWSNVIVNFHLSKEFNDWLKSRSRKIKSSDRLSYLFLLSTHGREFIKMIRNDPKLADGDYLIKIVQTKWIKEVD